MRGKKTNNKPKQSQGNNIWKISEQEINQITRQLKNQKIPKQLANFYLLYDSDVGTSPFPLHSNVAFL